MIDWLVLDKVQEKEAWTTEIKKITYKNNDIRHYANKELELTNKRVKILNKGNKKLWNEIKVEISRIEKFWNDSIK